MIEFKIPIPDNVIELSVIREDRLLRAMKEKCPHNRVQIDPTLTKIACKDCEKDLNPVEWLAQAAEHWSYIKRLYDDYNRAKAEFNEASKCKCRHCGKMTPVPRNRGSGLGLV